jgi:tetratricopeptide (TPR) repeat protein
MLRLTLKTRRTTRSSMASALALALMTSSAGVLGTAALTAPAQAQNSKDFVKVYQPIAEITNAEGGDYASAKAQIPTLLAAVKNEDDRNAAGSLVLALGGKLKDQALQRQGLELMLQSGKVAPEQVGQFQFYVGNLAFAAKDWAAARTALEAAVAAGYTADNPQGLIAESYINEGRHAEGLDYLRSMVEKQAAAGQPVDNAWLLRGLKIAYDNKLTDKAVEWSALHVKHSPSQTKWLEALQVVNSLAVDERQAQLDLLRLMLLTDSLTARNEYVAYIEAADPRVMSNEVGRVLASALQKGVFTASDEYYAEVKRIVDQRSSEDRASAPQLAADARKSSQARDAQNAGDVFLSLGSYAEAEEMFKLALEKTGVDRDQALTRLGIAQVQQGKNAEAKATFEQVSGPRTSVARMWGAYADTRA